MTTRPDSVRHSEKHPFFAEQSFKDTEIFQYGFCAED
jgi:hypothetical protein